MLEIGYALSSEEHSPGDLVRNARRAEEVGFTFALISDHFHPWVDHQGHSPFAWTVIGAIAQATQRLRLGTGVTCPLMRYHPAIVAQAAATAAALMPGRFFLGVGTGENLNEHILGQRWPSAPERLEMLEEAIQVIRLLWQGGTQSYRGRYYTVEHAQLYTLPEAPPPLMVAASGKKAAALAGRVGDGLICVSPNAEARKEFEAAGAQGKPRIGQLHVCWAASDAEARRIAHEWWPNAGLQGELSVELPLPRHFEQAVATVREEDIARAMVCSADPERHVAAIEEFARAGFDKVYVAQAGRDQEGFFRFYEREVLPRLRRTAQAA
jgi:coenzyme F420-dependent glucose-6-phosphate dehydrogenase